MRQEGRAARATTCQGFHLLRAAPRVAHGMPMALAGAGTTVKSSIQRATTLRTRVLARRWAERRRNKEAESVAGVPEQALSELNRQAVRRSSSCRP